MSKMIDKRTVQMIERTGYEWCSTDLAIIVCKMQGTIIIGWIVMVKES